MEKTTCACGQIAFNKIGVCWDCKHIKSRNCVCGSFLMKRQRACDNCKVIVPNKTKLRLSILESKGINIRKLLDTAYLFYGGASNFDLKFQGRERTRELARIRDEHTCQMCKKRWESGRRFDIHHLNGLCGKRSMSYDKVADLPSLITVCHKCHFNLEDHAGVRNWGTLEGKEKQLKRLRDKGMSYNKIGFKFSVKSSAVWNKLNS